MANRPPLQFGDDYANAPAPAPEAAQGNGSAPPLTIYGGVKSSVPVGPMDSSAAAPPSSQNREMRPPVQFGEPYSPEPSKPLDLRDIGMSAATRGAKSAIGTVIGAPGSIEETVGKDIPEFLRNRYLGMKERLDLISPEEKERAQKAPLYSDQTAGQAKGYNAPFTGMPTYRGVTETLPEAAPFLGYKSKTPEGKVAGEAAEFGAQGIAGGPRGLLGRVVTGAAGGAGGELAGQAAEQQGTSELGARLAGSLLGGLSAGALTHVGTAFLRPGSVAQDKLMQNVYQDMSRGESPMTLEQFNTAIKNGTPVTVLDLAGPKTKEFLSKYAEYNGANIDRVAELNTFLNNRLPEGNLRIQGTIKQQYGRDVGNSMSAPGMTDAVERAGRIERDQMYTLLRDHPGAQQVVVDELGDIRNNRVWRDAEKFAKDAANHKDWGIKVPQRTAEVPSVPGSILDEYGKPIMKPGAAATETPGNLAYYDQLKRGLDGIIAKADAANDTNTLVQAQAAKSKLVNILDRKVPDIQDASGNLIQGYGKTRDLASETFKAASAPEAGYKFFGMQNAYKRADLEKVLKTYTPEQRELFSGGYAARLNEIAGQSNGVKALAGKFLADRNFQERSRLALGQEAYDIFRAKTLSENLLNQAKTLNFIGNAPTRATSFGAGAGGAGATALAAGEFLLNNFTLSASTVGRAAVAAVGSAALGATFNLAEKRMAAQLIPLATKTDPQSMQQFARLLDGNPTARRVFNKMNTALNTAEQEAVKGYLAQPSQPERAAGGRTGYASGGAISPDAHADRLVAASERAHKGWQAETKPLLGASDNTIARALELANANT